MRREGRPAARLFAALGGVGGCDGGCLFVGARAGGRSGAVAASC